MIKFTTSPINITTNAVGQINPATFIVTLADCLGFANYANGFDEYCIKKVVIQTTAMQTGQSTLPAIANPRGYYYWSKNQFGITPASIGAIKQDTTSKWITGYRSFTISYRPNVLLELFRTLATSHYTPSWNRWLLCTTTNIPHYGVDFAGENFPPNAAMYQQRFNIYVGFRHATPT